VPLGIAALSEMRRDEGDELPFLAKGELATPKRDEPTPVPEPLRIEPPDWEAEAAERGDHEDPAAMFSGYAEYDPPPPALGPVERVEPLARPTFPAPDWRAEEQERARQAAADKRMAELEPEPQRYPAKRKTTRTWRN
jgi:hypothetical protein